MNEILGSNIMRLRKENDLTQEQLANGLGITYQAVSKWETGEPCAGGAAGSGKERGGARRAGGRDAALAGR